MSQKINIYADEWCDMVFEDKNRQYGAFILRKDSPKRHLRALIIAVVFFTLAVSSPVILKTILPEKKGAMTDVTKIIDVKIDKEKPKDLEKIIEEPKPDLKSSMKFVPPVIKPDDEVTDEDQPKTQDELINSKLNISIADVKGNNDSTGVDISTLEGNKDIAGDGDLEAPRTYVEQPPDFPGGEEERIRFLKQNVRFPQMARESGIDGTVYITFVVERSGKISNIKILRGIGGGCDDEAIRVVKLMPEWKPGKQNGQAVRVQFNMPIKFSLQ